MALNLTAVIITLNEEKNIEGCVESLGFCGQIVVVDGGSSDRTVELAKKMGATVYFRAFDDYASQKNFGISKARGDWLLLLDADERLSSGADLEIRARIQVAGVDGYFIKRENRLFGRWMHFGPHQNDLQLRLVKKSAAVFHGQVHERIIAPERTGKLRCFLKHRSTETVSDYMKKLNRYSDLEVRVLKERQEPFCLGRLKRRPWAVWARQVFLESSWRDGIEGSFFSVLSAYYEFVRRIKQWEAEQSIQRLNREAVK